MRLLDWDQLFYGASIPAALIFLKKGKEAK